MSDAIHNLEILKLDADEVHEILEQHILKDGLSMVLDLDASQGTHIVDKRTGKRYLDFFTYFATQPIGHNHPAIVDPSFVDHIGRVALTKPSNSDIYTEEMASFVDMMSRSAIPQTLPHLFLVSGGALAVENALKAAFDWKYQKRIARGLPASEDLSVIHFKEAFHGRSGYTMSLTNTDPAKVRHFPKFDWPRVTNPKISFPLKDNLAQVEALERQALSEIEDALAKDGDRIAALIIEPIQGEGGDNHFRTEFFAALRTICDENELLLIVDEVQTGVGTTGKFWAYKNYGFEPDILSFGKKMQVCGMLAGRRLDEVDSVFHVSSRINSTWGGNLVDMVRATRYLQVIEEENLVENAARMGERFLAGLGEIQAEHGDRIHNVRGKGLFIAFTLDDKAKRDDLLATLMEKGLMALSSGVDSIRFRPPLTVSANEVDQALAMVKQAIEDH